MDGILSTGKGSTRAKLGDCIARVTHTEVRMLSGRRAALYVDISRLLLLSEGKLASYSKQTSKCTRETVVNSS